MNRSITRYLAFAVLAGVLAGCAADKKEKHQAKPQPATPIAAAKARCAIELRAGKAPSAICNAVVQCSAASPAEQTACIKAVVRKETAQ